MNFANSIKSYIPQAVPPPLITGTNWIWKAWSLPAQSRTDIEIFKEALSGLGGDKIQVLEWGSGSSLRSHIAICALEETQLFKGLCQKYSSYLTSVQQLSGTRNSWCGS